LQVLHVAKLKPTDSQKLRQSLLRVLQNTGAGERNALARVEAMAQPGQPLFHADVAPRTPDFPEAAARRHWEKVRAHQAACGALKRDPGLRVALLDYFVNQTRKVRNPKVIEMALYQRTEQTALGDPLTGLFNRAYLMQVLRRDLRARRRRPLAVALFDVDDFKRINDTHGHLEGDRVLVKAAGVIGECLRDIDVAARYGGEEFAVVLPDTAARRVRGGPAHPRGLRGHRRSGREPVTVSGGVAAYPIDGLTPQQLLHCADQGLLPGQGRGQEPHRAGKRRAAPARARALAGDDRHRAPGRPFDQARGQNLSEGGMLVRHDRAGAGGGQDHGDGARERRRAPALRGHVVRLAAERRRLRGGLRLATDPTGGNTPVLRRLLPSAATA
jgi:diguanylate cyclase (GGDEF)-like protein